MAINNMETITKYKAYNGHEFVSPVECAVYEANCRMADQIISRLPPKPVDDGCSFSNGHGYIQHGSAEYAKVRRELLEQAAKETDHKWITQSLEDESVDPSWAGRIISERCTDNLWRAWHRLMCIDADLREWGQPFYAMNPSKAPEQRQLN